MKNEVHIFLDTNVFLHFPPLKDLDWCTIADAKSVKLIICMTVIHELDSKKSDTRLSSRAERAIKEIRNAKKSGVEIRSGVTVSVYNKEVRVADFPDSLSPECADDRIVHLVKLYLREYPGSEVAIATSDLGMELRAEAVDLESISLDTSLRLPNPQDELTKKYKQATNELNALKNRQPKLSLKLAHPDGPMKLPHEVIFELKDSWQPLDIDAELEKVKREQSKGNYFLSGLVSKESWDDYNNKLDEFYETYREPLDFLNEAKSKSFWFDLWLDNDGNGLASDIDVILTFPPIVTCVYEKGTEFADLLEKGIPKPKPPEIPEMFIGSQIATYSNVLKNLPNLSNFASTHRDEWTPETSVNRDDDKNEIHVQIGKLKHGHNVCLGKFVAIFGSQEDIGPFHVGFAISTMELIDKVSGKLNFVAKVKSSKGKK